jgi:hypothetical protein
MVQGNVGPRPADGSGTKASAAARSWAGAACRCTVGAPVGRVIPWRVARQQSPPPFHLAGGEYPWGGCRARSRMANEPVVSCGRLPGQGQGGLDSPRARFGLALSVAMDRPFVVPHIGSAIARKNLNPVSTVPGELHIETAKAAEASAEAAKRSAQHAGDAIQMAKDSEWLARRNHWVAVISAAAAFASAIVALIALFSKN